MSETTDEKPSYGDAKPWVMASWNGLPMWQCRFCPDNTLEGEDAAWDHYQTMHAPQIPAPPPMHILRVDRFGNPVQE